MFLAKCIAWIAVIVIIFQGSWGFAAWIADLGDAMGHYTIDLLVVVVIAFAFLFGALYMTRNKIQQRLHSKEEELS